MVIKEREGDSIAFQLSGCRGTVNLVLEEVEGERETTRRKCRAEVRGEKRSV